MNDCKSKSFHRSLSFAAMTWNDQYQSLKQTLQHLYDEGEASAIARMLVEHFGGRSFLALAEDKPGADVLQQLELALQQLLKYRPLQYVLNEAWFYGLKFHVNESVLIPRPETEELVDWIIKDVQSNKQVNTLRILDIGTGSGCVPISIRKHIAATVTAIDLSATALQTAKANATFNQTPVEFLQMDFLDESTWNQLGEFDIIISNPPYIKQSEEGQMHKNVVEHEPHLALFVPDNDALIFYRKILLFAQTHLAENGAVYVEINQQLGTETAVLFTENGFTVELKKDMSGNERMVKGSRS